jgi:PAS domain S-box-containing protein
VQYSEQAYAALIDNEIETMNYSSITRLMTPPRFHDDEENRIAGVVSASAFAILIGVVTLLVYRLVLGNTALIAPFLLMSAITFLSLVLVRRGSVVWSANLLTWSLLFFINFMIVHYHGTHDTAVLALPGVLVLAGLVLPRKKFLLITAVSLALISLIGLLEVQGVIHNRLSGETEYAGILDIVVILGIIAMTVRLMTNNLVRSLTLARESENAIRIKANQLKEAEKTLRDSEERFRTLYENSTIGLYRTTPDGRVMLANPTLVRMLGYTTFEEIALKNLETDTFAPTYDRQKFVHLIETRGEIQDLESAWTRKDGSVVYIRESARAFRDQQGRTLYYDGTVEDITERKKAEDALRESQEKYKLLLENMNEVVMLVDNDDTVLFVNRRFTELLGYEPEDILGRVGHELLVDPADHGVIKKANAERKSRIYSQYELDFISKDGKKIPFLVNGAPLVDGDGCVVGSIGTLTDISDRKRLERQLIQAQKLEGVGTLAGGIAHDFNNLLAMILGSAELLEHRIGSQPDLKKYVDRIIEASERGTSISRQLLIFSRPDQAKMEQIALSRTICELHDMLLHFLPKSITVKISTTDADGAIVGDAGQIHQALLNLVLNAADAMANMGTVTIKENVVSPEIIQQRFQVEPAGAYIAVSVADTGVGMPESVIAKIFDPFFTTKGPGKGTGLGLAMVHGIVKNHGGFIDVVSTPGAGTTFTLYFPLVSLGMERTAA